MARFMLIPWLLCMAAGGAYAQNQAPQDSVRLRQKWEGGEPELNREVLREFRESFPSDNLLQMSTDKPWLEYDTRLPADIGKPKPRVILTLTPYKPNTRYDWDPVLQKKIKIDKDTWRGPFYRLKSLMYPTNWAKHPLDAGPRETLEQIEATGLRYRVNERANGMAVGRWQPAAGCGIGGLDLMKPFTREFWNFKGRKRRARTLKTLQLYGDSSAIAPYSSGF